MEIINVGNKENFTEENRESHLQVTKNPQVNQSEP